MAAASVLVVVLHQSVRSSVIIKSCSNSSFISWVVLLYCKHTIYCVQCNAVKAAWHRHFHFSFYSVDQASKNLDRAWRRVHGRVSLYNTCTFFVLDIFFLHAFIHSCTVTTYNRMVNPISARPSEKPSTVVHDCSAYSMYVHSVHVLFHCKL